MINYKLENNSVTAIITFSSNESYFSKIKDNHILYCQKHLYNYYILNNDKCSNKYHIMNKFKNNFPNLEYVLCIDSDTLFTNHNIPIKELLNNKFIRKDINDEVILINYKINNNTIIDHIDLLKDSNKLEILNHDFYSYYTDYKPYQYLLSLKNIEPKIDIIKQIDLFNNLSKTEDKYPKIIISVAVIPSRIEGLDFLVQTLMESTVKPYKIVFTLPSEYKLFKNSNEHIEHISKKLNKYIKEGIVYINEIKVNNIDTFDYGPCNKWIGAYEYIEKDKNLENDNYVVIVLDDDLCYHKDILEMFVNEHLSNKRHICTGYTNYSNYGNKITIPIYAEKKRIYLGIKGANGTLVPKHFYCNMLYPTFKNTLNNGIKKYKDFIFQDDNIITTFIYYCKYDVKSIYNKIRESKKSLSYYHNRKNSDASIGFQGVSGKNSCDWYDKSHTRLFLMDFVKFFVF